MKTAVIAILILLVLVLEIIFTIGTLTLYAFIMAGENEGFLTQQLIRKL